MVSGCTANEPAARTPAPPPPASAAATSNSPTSSPTSPAQPTQRVPAKPKRTSVTVVMNGDLLWHNTLWFGAREDARRRGHGGYDFAPLLAGMKPVIASADMAICHEEVPLAPSGGPYRNYPLFAAPPHVVKAIVATGYDVCTTASNHAIDQGFAGLRRTLDDLDRAKIPHVGTARTKAESERPMIFTTKEGVKIAIVAATFSLNGLAMPEGKPWAVQRLSARSLLRQAHRARTAGADIVLAAVHVGTEYSTSENAQQVKLARTLTASPDVDLVYMHHPHVVQPWTTVNKKWVLYGVGNTVAQQETNARTLRRSDRAVHVYSYREWSFHGQQGRIHSDAGHLLPARPAGAAIPGLGGAEDRQGIISRAGCWRPNDAQPRS